MSFGHFQADIPSSLFVQVFLILFNPHSVQFQHMSFLSCCSFKRQVVINCICKPYFLVLRYFIIRKPSRAIFAEIFESRSKLQILILVAPCWNVLKNECLKRQFPINIAWLVNLTLFLFFFFILKITGNCRSIKLGPQLSDHSHSRKSCLRQN